VISQPYAQHRGVVQYDLGKTGVGGQVTRTGSLNTPPTVLLSALSKLRSNHYRGRSSPMTSTEIATRAANTIDKAGNRVEKEVGRESRREASPKTAPLSYCGHQGPCA